MKTKSINLLLATSTSLFMLGCSPKPTATSSSDSTVENKIEGAFGKKFGDVFDPRAAGKDALEDGTPMYRFVPEKPLRSLDTYYVLITPTTHKIYSIWASGDAQASNEQDLIMQMIEQKYGAQPKDETSLDDFDHDTRHYHQGTRSIMTRIRRYTQPIIEIRYTDYPLSNIADAEKAEIVKQNAKKLDNSGL